ncbi:MAG: hypothetical protein ACHQT9_02605 [Candidatus Saccharimonadales bacterium]
MMPIRSVEIQDFAKTPIPEIPSVEGWKDVPISETDESLVSLDEIGIFSASFYAGVHDFSPYGHDSLPGALQKVYVREGLGHALLKAQDLLPDNLCLVGLDGFRPKPVQNSLYSFFLEQLKDLKPDWTDEAREEYTQKYVSKPSINPVRPAPHTTGGSIDQWILKLPDGYSRHDIVNEVALSTSMWLSAGAAFDHGGERSALRYYEEHDGPGAKVFRVSRRIMYWLMHEVGIEAYEEEFWHGNFGNQMAAQTAGIEAASYGVIELSAHQQQAEQILQAQRSRYGEKILTNLAPGEIIRPEFDA